MKASSGGLGVTSVLTIVFVVLKLADVINWPWIWVLAPLWIGGGLGVTGLLIVICVIFGIANAQRRKV